jgi:hypothetical protein
MTRLHGSNKARVHGAFLWIAASALLCPGISHATYYCDLTYWLDTGDQWYSPETVWTEQAEYGEELTVSDQSAGALVEARALMRSVDEVETSLRLAYYEFTQLASGAAKLDWFGFDVSWQVWGSSPYQLDSYPVGQTSLVCRDGTAPSLREIRDRWRRSAPERGRRPPRTERQGTYLVSLLQRSGGCTEDPCTVEIGKATSPWGESIRFNEVIGGKPIALKGHLHSNGDGYSWLTRKENDVGFGTFVSARAAGPRPLIQEIRAEAEDQVSVIGAVRDLSSFR